MISAFPLPVISANEVTNTQVIFYSRDLAILRNPLFKEKTKNITQRSSQVICSDIDKDGKLEIPVTLDLPKQSGDSKNIYADKIIWNSFDAPKEALVAKQAVIINYDYMFMMNYADKWSENKVTAMFLYFTTFGSMFAIALAYRLLLFSL